MTRVSLRARHKNACNDTRKLYGLFTIAVQFLVPFHMAPKNLHFGAVIVQINEQLDRGNCCIHISASCRLDPSLEDFCPPKKGLTSLMILINSLRLRPSLKPRDGTRSAIVSVQCYKAKHNRPANATKLIDRFSCVWSALRNSSIRSHRFVTATNQCN